MDRKEVYSCFWGGGEGGGGGTYTFLPFGNTHISYSSVPCCHLEGELWAFCSCDESLRMGDRRGEREREGERGRERERDRGREEEDKAGGKRCVWCAKIHL